MLGIKGWIGGAMVLVGLIALAIIARNWSCRKQAGPRVRTYSYAVASVPNGATIAIKTGLRQRRTGQVHIAGIAAPADGRFAEPSRANLQQLAGGRIRVEITRHGLFGDAETDEVSADEVLDARGELVGTVYGESGADLGIGQLRAGCATALPDAEKDLLRAEKEAKVAKLGIWAK